MEFPVIGAEISGNHNGSIERAYDLIDAAKRAGASAVKLQTYTPDTMTIDHDSPDFMIKEGIWKGKTLYELYEEAQTPWEWHEPLFNYAAKKGITIFSSPFDESAVDFLETLDCPIYKIASFEAVDINLIKYAAKTGKPLIISCGVVDTREHDRIFDPGTAFRTTR
jgi:N-acetylneuraminate synthase